MKRNTCRYQGTDGKRCGNAALITSGYCPDHTYLRELGTPAYERRSKPAKRGKAKRT